MMPEQPDRRAPLPAPPPAPVKLEPLSPSVRTDYAPVPMSAAPSSAVRFSARLARCPACQLWTIWLIGMRAATGCARCQGPLGPVAGGWVSGELVERLLGEIDAGLTPPDVIHG